MKSFATRTMFVYGIHCNNWERVCLRSLLYHIMCVIENGKEPLCDVSSADDAKELLDFRLDKPTVVVRS